MLQINSKRIDLSMSEILYQRPFSEASLKEDFEISGGVWSLQGEWLTGIYRENAGALVYLKEDFSDDILLDFEGRTIPPCDNDLNFAFRTEGWDYAKNDAGRGYIGGLAGWWDGKAGIEHYPQCTPWAGTSMFHLVPGRTYHIQTGAIGGHIFLIVDGELIVELFDPTVNELKDCHRVGLGAYCSQVQFRNLKVLRPKWEQIECSYVPNF